MIGLDNLEIDIISNCNLRCEHCSVGAPYLDSKVYDLDRFKRDIKTLAAVAHLNRVLLLGGDYIDVNKIRRIEHVDEFLAAEFDDRSRDPNNGHIYLCTEGQRRGRYLQAIGSKGAEHLVDPKLEGCDLHAPELGLRLMAYLHRQAREALKPRGAPPPPPVNPAARAQDHHAP